MIDFGEFVANASLAGLAKLFRGDLGMVAKDGSPMLIPRANPRRRLVGLGDSLTYGGQPYRYRGLWSGKGFYIASLNTSTLGATWVIDVAIDGGAPTHPDGLLETDGAGNLRWTLTGDGTPGPWTNVANGGWYYLSSGTSPYGLYCSVRGGTAPPASATSGAVTTSAAAVPNIQDYNLLGYWPWLAGALGDTFSDYEAYGISGATTADILKFTPQALATDVEAVVILMGVNDNPTTAAVAATLIANTKATIDLARAKARRVYVCDIFPYPGATATVQKFLALASSAIRAYCRTKQNVRFVSAFDRLYSPNASSITGYASARAGCFNPGDSLHLMPYGGYQAGAPIVTAVAQDYPIEPIRRSAIETWDSTLQVGAWNSNPMLRGTAGTVTASQGTTGTTPDGTTLQRAGTTQLCTTSFDASLGANGLSDGGADWFCLSVSGAAANDYHKLIFPAVAVPAGVNVGDYFQITVETKPFSTSGTGIAIFSVQANSNALIQNAYLHQLQSGRQLATFTTEQPPLLLRSEPQKLVAGVTSFDLQVRLGADSGGGTGKVGFRILRIDKVPGPIYP